MAADLVQRDEDQFRSTNQPERCVIRAPSNKLYLYKIFGSVSFCEQTLNKNILNARFKP